MKKLIYLLSIMILGMSSCESNYLEFSAENSVFFSANTDTTKVSFTYFDNAIQEYDVTLFSKIIGDVVDYDREVKVKVTTKDCVEGEDYLPIPETYTITAGEIACPIKISLIRNETLKEVEKTINIEFVESKDFATNHTKENNKLTNSKTINKIRHTIIYSESMNEAPVSWKEYYLGTFSYKKFTTICDVMSISRTKFIDNSYMSHSRSSYVANSMKKYFADQKVAGKTIYEEDGITEMKMGDKI